MDAADILFDLIACDDLVYDDVLGDLVQLDVVLLFPDVRLDILNVGIVLLLVVDADVLVDVVSLGDLDVQDLGEEIAVYLLVDVLVDVLGLDAYCG